MSDQSRYMARALHLASLGRHASPNPMVGCVIVAPDGSVVGEGFHPKAGQPHAEVFALREAGEAARGATAYVTLEPCSHFGRTPPCADALIAAGVSRVVVAMLDPDSRVSGRGAERLRDAGIAVEVGLCESNARKLNAPFIKHRTTGTPYVIVKVAQTLDGKIATESGDSRWITSPITRAWVHRQLRDRADAILVGVGTVLADDPSLTTRSRSRPVRNPTPIVLDSHLRTSPSARLIVASECRPLIACVKPADNERDAFDSRRIALETSGAEVIECERTADRRVDLLDLMRKLGAKGDILSVLIEGGGRVIGNALRAGIVDRYIVTIAPKFVGGSGAPGPVTGEPLATTMADALSAERWIVRTSGPDVVIDTFIRKD